MEHVLADLRAAAPELVGNVGAGSPSDDEGPSLRRRDARDRGDAAGGRAHAGALRGDRRGVRAARMFAACEAQAPRTSRRRTSTTCSRECVRASRARASCAAPRPSSRARAAFVAVSSSASASRSASRSSFRRASLSASRRSAALGSFFLEAFLGTGIAANGEKPGASSSSVSAPRASAARASSSATAARRRSRARLRIASDALLPGGESCATATSARRSSAESRSASAARSLPRRRHLSIAHTLCRRGGILGGLRPVARGAIDGEHHRARLLEPLDSLRVVRAPSSRNVFASALRSATNRSAGTASSLSASDGSAATCSG